MIFISSMKRIDFMARSPELNLAGKSGAKSYYGSVISLGVITAMALIVYKAFADYMDTTGPQVVQITNFVKEFPRTNLIENRVYPVIFGFFANETQMTHEEVLTHITPVAAKYTYKVQKNAQGVDDVVFDKYQVKRGIPCKDVGEEGLKMLDALYGSDQMKLQLRRSGFCFPYDKEFMSVVGGFGYSAEYLYMEISPCSLAVGCVDQTTLMSSYFGVTFSEATFDPSNKENPVRYTASNTELVRIQPGNSGLISNRLKRTQVEDSGGIMTSDILRSDTFSIANQVFKFGVRVVNTTTCLPSEFLESIPFPTCVPYFVMEFQGTGSVVKYKRTYKGILELAADVGGLYEIIALIGLLMYLPFAWYINKKTLLAKIFPFITLAKKDNSLFKKQLGQSTDQNTVKKRLLNCCRKRKEEDILLDQMEDAGMDVVEKSLDVVEIVKSLDRLKVITSVLFHSYHYKLIPIMAMDLHIKQDQDKKELKKDKSSGGVSPLKKSTTRVQTVTSADMVLDYEEAIDILKGDPISQQRRGSMFPSGKFLSAPSSNEKQPAGDVIKSLLDQYCISHLKNSHLINFEEEPKPLMNMMQIDEFIDDQPEQLKPKQDQEPSEAKPALWDPQGPTPDPKDVKNVPHTSSVFKKPAPAMFRKKIG
jgi:hypothetical protein